MQLLFNFKISASPQPPSHHVFTRFKHFSKCHTKPSGTQYTVQTVGKCMSLQVATLLLSQQIRKQTIHFN